VVRIRLRFSIARVMAAVLSVALVFTVFRPTGLGLPATCVLAFGVLIPIFVANLTGPEVAVIIAIMIVVAMMQIPPVLGHDPKKRAAALAKARAARAAAPSAVPGPR
jgi:hypothetical protein